MNGDFVAFGRCGSQGLGRWRIGDERTTLGSVDLDGSLADSVWFIRHPYGNGKVARYNLRRQAISVAPKEVNARGPVTEMSASGDHLAFRTYLPIDGRGKLYVYDLRTGALRTITVYDERFIQGGQVNGDYVVFARCRGLCAIYRYRISTRTTRQITNRIGSLRLTSPAVLSDGTVYYVKGYNDCGGGV